MMKNFTVKNPTSKSKAVRVKGGHKVMKPNAAAIDVVADWDEHQIESYRNCGLDIKEKAAVKPADKPAGSGKN